MNDISNKKKITYVQEYSNGKDHQCNLFHKNMMVHDILLDKWHSVHKRLDMGLDILFEHMLCLKDNPYLLNIPVCILHKDYQGSQEDRCTTQHH